MKELSIAVLLAVFAAGTLLPINLGLLGFAAAFIVGTLIAGIAPRELLLVFPGDIFITLVGITCLFGIAQRNGTIDRIVNLAARATGGRAAAMPWIAFALSATLSALGAIPVAVCGIVVPVASRFAHQYRLSPLMMGLMVVHGAQAGGFSPISVYGVIVNNLVARSGFESVAYPIFIASLLFNLIAGIVVYLILHHRTRRTAPDPDAAPLETGEGWSREQVFTIFGLGALVTATIGFSLPIGFVAITIVVLLGIVAPRSQQQAVESVSWPTTLMICGVVTYLGVMEKLGTVAWVGNGIQGMGAPLMAALMLSYLGGVVSAFASSTALLGTLLPLAMPFLMAGDVSAAGTIAAICISLTIVDTSPFSSVGAIVIAMTDAAHRERLYRQLLGYAALTVSAGPLLAWAGCVLVPSLL